MKSRPSQVAMKLKKSKLKPTARGIRPSTVVIAVSNTGRRRVAPPSTMASRMSVNSRSAIFSRPCSSTFCFMSNVV